MSDEEISRSLSREQRVPIGAWVIRLGFLCILVSVIWRLARAILVTVLFQWSMHDSLANRVHDIGRSELKDVGR
jgi:hypothetical protein